MWIWLVPERRLQTELTWEFQFQRNAQPEKKKKKSNVSQYEPKRDEFVLLTRGLLLYHRESSVK